MRGIATNGSLTSGHTGPYPRPLGPIGPFPPTACISSCTNVFFEGNPPILDGDATMPHTRLVGPFDTHSSTCVASTSTKVYVNGKRVVIMGDDVECGGTVASSTTTIFVR